MNQDKKVEIIKRKNERLKKQVDDYKLRLELEQHENRLDAAKVEAFMDAFTVLQSEYCDIITELRRCREEYLKLINELSDMKYDLKEIGIKPPIYIRIYYKLKKHLHGR